jgi:hypothetical protein
MARERMPDVPASMATTYAVGGLAIVQRRFRLGRLPPPEVRRVGAGFERLVVGAVGSADPEPARGVRRSASVRRW